MRGNSYLVIVGSNDCPVYQAEFGPQTQAATGKTLQCRRHQDDEPKHMNQFVVYSALDHVRDVMWGTHAMNLQIVDSFEDFSVSAYLLPCGVQFLLLHDPIISATPDSIKSFFTDTHEVFIRYLLNPFVEPTEPIRSVMFDTKIKELLRKWF